jgi:hypothetical protein
LIPDPYGRLFDEIGDPEARIPDPPDEWPWRNAAGDAEALTLHLPGKYTLTVDRRPRDPEDG